MRPSSQVCDAWRLPLARFQRLPLPSKAAAIIAAPREFFCAAFLRAASAALRPAMTPLASTFQCPSTFCNRVGRLAPSGRSKGPVGPHILRLDHDNLTAGQRELVTRLSGCGMSAAASFSLRFLDHARGSWPARMSHSNPSHRQGDGPERAARRGRPWRDEGPQGILGSAVGDSRPWPRMRAERSAGDAAPMGPRVRLPPARRSGTSRRIVRPPRATARSEPTSPSPCSNHGRGGNAASGSSRCPCRRVPGQDSRTLPQKVRHAGA